MMMEKKKTECSDLGNFIVYHVELFLTKGIPNFSFPDKRMSFEMLLLREFTCLTLSLHLGLPNLSFAQKDST